MAQFLYRLGLAAYDHRKKFIAGWLAVLAIIGLLAGLFMGKLSNTFSLPGTETQRVLELMHKELPELSGGNGTVVFQTKNLEAFTPEQRAAVTNTMDQLADLGTVRSVMDPFVMQDSLDSALTTVEQGKKDLEENRTKLEDGKTQLADGEAQLAAGEQQLADGQREIDANTQKLAEGRNQLAEGQAALDDAQAELEDAKAQLTAGEKQLADGKAQLAAGEKKYNDAQAQLTAGEKQLAAAQQQLASGKKELATQRAAFEDGVAELTAGLGVSTLPQVPGAISVGLQQVADAREQLADLEAERDKLIANNQPVPEELTTGIIDLKKNIDDNAAQLTAAQTAYEQLSAAQPQLAAAQAQINAGQKEIAANQAKLDEGRKQLAASLPALEAARQQVTDGQQQLDAGRAKYNAGLEQFEAGQKELKANQTKLEDGEAQLAAARQQVSDGKRELEANRTKLEQARKDIEDGQAQLESGQLQLEQGERTANLSAPMRFVSSDNTTAIAQVMFKGQAESLTPQDRDAILATADAAKNAGVEVMFSKEIMSDLNSIFGPTEAIGFIIAGVVLMIMLGTFVAAGLPLLMALAGVGAGVGGTLALSSLIDMQSITPALALMLGLAVGIDYSLFIVHRHRTQLLAGMDLRESVGRAIGTSGNAVVFAGLTVIIALSALVVSGIPFMAILGLSAAFTVLMSVLLSITLSPALISVIGERLLTKRARAKRAAAIANGGVRAESAAVAAGNRKSPSLWWAGTLTKRPWLSTIASVVALGIIAIPAASMLTALPDGGSEPYGSQAQRAYAITSAKFGEGFNGQLIVMAQLPEVANADEANGVLLDVAERLSTEDGVFAAIPATTNEDLTFGAIQVVPTTGPSSPDTEAVVHNLRDLADTVAQEDGVQISVTGQVAAQVDVSEKISSALGPYLTIVVGLSLILLLLVFRSIVVPVIATLGFLLSLAASFGATVAVYQWGWLGSLLDVHNPAPIMSFLPILLTGILFGLAMDYQVFLVTAIREAYAHGSDSRRAIKEGFNLAAPVVVAAALIMVSVFASFTFSHLTMIRPIGFALAVGVLFDAFVVRMTLTPAVMHLLGDKAWYLPKWLDRILPDVDVEGAKLEHSLEDGSSDEADLARHAAPVDVSITDDSLRF